MRVFFTILLYSLCLNVFSQKEANIWYFGGGAGLDFNFTPIKVLLDGQSGRQEGNGCLSDSNGKLIYYTNGEIVWNNKQEIIKNGIGLSGRSSATQGSIIITHPKNEKITYIFTNQDAGADTCTSFTNTLSNDSINVKNKLFLKFGSEKLNAVNHQNNMNVWVATHSYINDTFYFFLITKNGIIDCPVINKISKYQSKKNGAQGQIKFSNDGNYLGCSFIDFTNRDHLLAKFNSEKGLIESHFLMNLSAMYSSEFSPNQKYIYTSDFVTGIHQFDISKFDSISVNKSKKLIKLFNKFDLDIRGMQYATDKKIYVAQPGNNYLGTINNPDSAGVKCGFRDSGIYLGGRKSTYSLPNFNQSYFYTPSIDYAYEQNCRNNAITFEGKDTIKATNYKWIFSKGTITTIKTTKDANYIFADTGKWQVKYIASNGIRTDTVTKTITIMPKLEQGFLGEINYCNISPLPFTLHSPKDLHCVHWYDSSMNEIGRTDSLKISHEGIYYCKATNLSFCVEWDTIRISKSTPKANFETNDVCESDSAVFMNKSIYANNFIWKFGDGETSNIKNARHKYLINASTTFNVTLLAISDGCTDSATKQVTINKNPNSNFTYTQATNTFDLKAENSGLANYKWTFGKTDSITKTIPNHTYTAIKGQEKICLIVTDLAGCQSQTCTTAVLGIKTIFKETDIRIYPNPSKGKIIININKSGIYSAKVYNETGQLVFEKSIQGHQQYTLTISQTAGNYLVEISDSEGRRMNRKVVIE